jgi:hypothetical protein
MEYAIADNNVLKTVRTITTKKPIARRACWDLRTERYITSIVLYMRVRQHVTSRGIKILTGEWCDCSGTV